ncbi:hypothetical protein Patl1_26895 [Pistacia atlantica]|uniref:Uncharacterized protein n=1 Tax=Pistacia atlantica TaxID=434234 RepID=A0ACC1B265_9ROSI|nr:hypothetical protein Patl1_26895 [Pistacia atlantica]
MPWVLDIARRFGIDGAPFFTQPWAVNAIYYHFHQGRFKIPLEGPIISLPSMPPLRINDLPSFFKRTDSFPFLINFVVRQFSKFEEWKWVFCNTFDKLEEESTASKEPFIKKLQILQFCKALASKGLKLILLRTTSSTTTSNFIQTKATSIDIEIISDGIEGKGRSMPLMPQLKINDLPSFLDGTDSYPSLLNLFKPSTGTCTTWLDPKETGSVVYVSFGSLGSQEKEQIEEVAWGLKRSLVVSWSPQPEVLGHKSVGCFMTHCGWNSTLEALSLGVPMMAMPIWTDQTSNAKFVEDVWQVGVRIRVNEQGIVTIKEIEVCIKEVMEGEKSKEMRRNSGKWKELAKEAVDEGGSSDRNIEEFVAKLACAAAGDHSTS